MTGNEHGLTVHMGETTIATLAMEDDQLIWSYDTSWRENGFAVSPSLPLDNQIPYINIERFLRNLLPEGHCLDVLLTSFHLSRSNTYGLVRTLGLDMSGALVVLAPEQGFPIKAIFRSISDDELQERIAQRSDRSLLIWDAKPRLSSAGVQDKINVVVDDKMQLGFGEGRLCSTHLLKFEKQNVEHLVLNEYLTMLLAKCCGLSVADVDLKRYGKFSCLLVKRFDRQFISNKEVKRRHLIDGCQALNLPPDYKYERNFGSAMDVAHIRDGVSLKKLFLFAEQCINPALVKMQMLDWVMFNIIVSNYDAHGKNISFFVGKNGISLAPFYDLVNIKMYQEFKQDMAMALGDEFDGNTVNAYQLADFADSCGLSRALVSRRLKIIITKIQQSIASVSQHAVKTDEERRYVDKYQSLVVEHCEHLIQRVDELVKIEL